MKHKDWKLIKFENKWALKKFHVVIYVSGLVESPNSMEFRTL